MQLLCVCSAFLAVSDIGHEIETLATKLKRSGKKENRRNRKMKVLECISFFCLRAPDVFIFD